MKSYFSNAKKRKKTFGFGLNFSVKCWESYIISFSYLKD